VHKDPSFQTLTGKSVIKLYEIPQENTNLKPNKKFAKAIIFQNVMYFFEDELTASTNISAFDFQTSQWIITTPKNPLKAKILLDPL